MKMKTITTFALCAALLVGCAGREAQRITVVQDGDFSRDCESLHLESQSINSQVKSLITENSKKQGKNAALTVVSVVVFLPALFALDLKGAAKAEFEALHERNKHLANIAASKGCDPIVVKDLDQFKEEIAAEKRAEANRQPAPQQG